MKSTYYTIIIFLTAVFFFAGTTTHSAHAASVTATSTRLNIHEGEEVAVDVLLNPEEESFNAISGALHFDPTVLKPYSISTVNSVVSMWVDTPSNQGSSIEWSGLMPGGFGGVVSPFYDGTRPGRLMRISFVASALASSTELSFDTVNVYKNDGKGIPLSISGSPLILHIVPGDAVAAFLPDPHEPQNTQGSPVHRNIPTDAPSSNVLIWDIIAGIFFVGIIALYTKRRCRK
jgi:hypothetical protein